METYHLGRGGLSWASQADIQNGTVGVEGALQPLELRSGQNLMELLRAAGQTWLNGSPSDFTKPGQPRTWSNDGPFNQVNGPLQLVDGDPSSSSEGAFRTARNQAGATFFWDLGAPFPIERVRFAPAPGELDWFIKAFELRVSDGEQFDEVRRPVYRLLSRVEDNKDPVVELFFNGVQGRFPPAQGALAQSLQPRGIRSVRRGIRARVQLCLAAPFLWAAREFRAARGAG